MLLLLIFCYTSYGPYRRVSVQTKKAANMLEYDQCFRNYAVFRKHLYYTLFFRKIPGFRKTFGGEVATNHLGLFLQGQLRAKGMSQTQLSQTTGISMGYISRIVKGNITDGPSDSYLEKIATALSLLDSNKLKELRDQDRQADVSGGTLATDRIAATEDEYLLLRAFRAMGTAERAYLIATARLAAAGFLSDKLPSSITSANERSLGGRLPELWLDLARKYTEVGQELVHLRHLDEALVAFQTSEDLYRRLRQIGRSAMIRMRIARVYSEMAENPEDTPGRRLYWLHTADFLYSEVAAAFAEHVEDLTIEEREHVAENSMLWADNDIRRAELVEDEDEADAYRRRAYKKRMQASIELQEWQEFVETNFSHPEAASEKIALLCEVHHRLALLHQRLCEHAERLPLDTVSAEEEMFPVRKQHYEQAISHFYINRTLRRRQIRQARHDYDALVQNIGIPVTEEQKHRLFTANKWCQRLFNRLVNAHNEVGYAVQQCHIESGFLEKAYWHYLISLFLGTYIAPDFDPNRTTQLAKRMAEIESHLDTATIRTLRQQVKAELNDKAVSTLIYNGPDGIEE